MPNMIALYFILFLFALGILAQRLGMAGPARKGVILAFAIGVGVFIYSFIILAC